MANKKMKPVAEDMTEQDVVQTESAQTEIVAPIVGAKSFTEEVKDKIARLEDANVELTRQNSDLTDKMAELIEENAKLKEQLKSAKKPDAKPANDKEVKELREENDNYLMKISELTFENAKLTAQMQEASAAVNQAKSKLANIKPKSIYNPYRNLNGYSAWN